MGKIILGLLLFVQLCSCNAEYEPYVRSAVTKLSVSSDGRYVITSHYGRYLILWDIQKKTRQVISQHASIYSAYFIRDTHNFLWQDIHNNIVYVQSVNGDVVKTLQPGFTVFGHVMTTDLKHYVASKLNATLVSLENGRFKLLKHYDYEKTGSARVLQLQLENKYLLSCDEQMPGQDTHPFSIGRSDQEYFGHHSLHLLNKNRSSLDGFVLWDIIERQPIRRFFGPHGIIMSALSPDYSHIVGVDENGWLYGWHTKIGKQLFFTEPFFPDFANEDCGYNPECKEKVEKQKKTYKVYKVLPEDYNEHPWANGVSSIAVRFIDEKGHFIKFLNSVNYALLYNLSSPHTLSIMNLGKDPQPYTFSVFTGANGIDTAPKARILVMAQSKVYLKKKHFNSTGIIVYRFNEKTLQLERLWAPDGPPPHKRIVNQHDKWEY